jgi:hypothetical protein
MWLYRFLLAVLGGSCLVILSAALTRTAASVAPAAPAPAEVPVVAPAPAPVADAGVEHVLEQALDALRADRVNWLEMAIWQKVQLPGYVYEADGFYRLAPGHRFRLEMHTHMGEAEGTLLMVSDGRQSWQAVRSGEGPWENVTRLNLSEVFAVMSGPSETVLHEEFFQRPHFQGMMPLLRSLRSRLVWARGETTRKAGGEQLRLVGVWSQEESAKFSPADKPWPVCLPRQCLLYLDSHTYWPERVEWWGPSAAGGVDRLLVQMAFRNPVVNHPLAADACERLFAFHPGDVSVEDETKSVTADLSHRAEQLAAENAAR